MKRVRLASLYPAAVWGEGRRPASVEVAVIVRSECRIACQSFGQQSAGEGHASKDAAAPVFGLVEEQLSGALDRALSAVIPSAPPWRGIDMGETFSGVDYATGLDAVEEIRSLVPTGVTMAQFALRWILMLDGRAVLDDL